MKHARLWLALAGTASMLTSKPVSAWGWQGHEYVGSVAWQLLNPNAKRHVSQLLGANLDLAHAAVWPDCVRDVRSTSTGFRLIFGPKSPKVCKQLPEAEQSQMVAYAKDNWTNCEYSHRQTECHKAFHFADVNVHEHSDYDVSYFGAKPFDVVQAIKAATAVLKCKAGQSCDAPEPFKITSKRQALLLLAHFVGDVHQPLHVGAIYLDSNSQETDDTGQETIGGNALLLTPDGDNLHGEWDSISNPNPKPDAIAQACHISPLPNPTPEPPEKWAAESVAAARSAYSGMSFSPDAAQAKHWDIHFNDPDSYEAARRQEQGVRLIQAGARLASILNSVWPSRKTATACR